MGVKQKNVFHFPFLAPMTACTFCAPSNLSNYPVLIWERDKKSIIIIIAAITNRNGYSSGIKGENWAAVFLSKQKPKERGMCSVRDGYVFKIQLCRKGIVCLVYPESVFYGIKGITFSSLFVFLLLTLFLYVGACVCGYYTRQSRCS